METQIQTLESQIKDFGIKPATTPTVEPAESDKQRLISEIKYLELDELKAHPRNAEIYGNAPDEDLIKNIKANGVLTPLLATYENVILSGHQRHQCARLAGLTQVPVVFTDSTDEHDMIELLLDGNVQRKKSDDAIFQEVLLWKEIESIKAKKRQATSIKGKMGGQPLLPAEVPEGVGEVRTIVARKCEIGEKKVDEIGKIATKIEALKERGHDEEAKTLRETIGTDGIRAAAKQVKELEMAESGLSPSPANPAKPKVDKSKIITGMQKDLTRGIGGWSIAKLTLFASDLAVFRKTWETNHPVNSVNPAAF